MHRTSLAVALFASTLIIGHSADAVQPAGDCSEPLVAEGTYVDISMPGSTAALPQAINDRGDIVGRALSDDPEEASGFILRRGEFTRIMVPGSFNTSPMDMNNAGVVVGFYCVPPPLYGCGAFSWRDGEFTTWPTSDDYWALGQQLKAINNAGTIVGRTGDHGLLLRQGSTGVVDVPNATYTSVEDINDRGDLLIGAFLPDPPRSEYFVQRNGRLQVVSGCAAGHEAIIRLTNRLEFVGWARLGGTEPSIPRVGLITSSRGVSLYRYPGSDAPYGWTGLYDVNSSGYVVGAARTGELHDTGDLRGFVFVPGRR
jgi:hypothetical protein